MMHASECLKRRQGDHCPISDLAEGQFFTRQQIVDGPNAEGKHFRGLKGNFIANTMGTKQSLLAQRAAPPRKKGMALFLIGWFLVCVILTIILIIVMIDSKFEGSIGRIGLAVGCIAFVWGAVWRGKTVGDYNSRTWSKAYARWERSYLCTQCGRVNII
jgi:hypothetical protein